MVNEYYGRDLDRMLTDWRAIWGAKTVGDRPNLMGELFDTMLVHLARRLAAGELAKTTHDDYVRCIASLRPVWARVRIIDVAPPMLGNWQEVRGALSRTRCNRERTTLSECFKVAIMKGSAKANPVDHLKPFKEKPRDRYVEDWEFAAVAKHAPTVVQAAMLLAAITGLRQGDILRTRRADFGHHGLTLKTRKTGKEMIYKWTEGLELAVVTAVGARDFIPLILLSTEDGKPYTSDGFRTMWHRSMGKALEDGSLQKRYTFNDLRAKAGSDSRDWKLLGHLDQRTFERVYNRLPRVVTPNR